MSVCVCVCKDWHEKTKKIENTKPRKQQKRKNRREGGGFEGAGGKDSI